MKPRKEILKKRAGRTRLAIGIILAILLCCGIYGVWALVAAPNAPADDPLAALSGKPVVDIREKLFIAQCNDVYLNANQYMDSVIRYEGIFGDLSGGADRPYCYVYRNSPGCCGNDGVVGFEVIWDQPYPPQNAWVEAMGTLERYEEWGNTYLRLQLVSLTELPERGLEFVTQ